MVNKTTGSDLDVYYASLLHESDRLTCFENVDNLSVHTDTDDKIDSEQSATNYKDVQDTDINEILTNLAKEINPDCISKFNVSRSFIWEGAKRGLSRKSFSPKNKVSVKFTDDAGNSEGAVDMGGPMKEFFTLVIQWMITSQLFCGPENAKFLSWQAKSIEENEYYFAGMMLAMSIVHGGPGPQCFAPEMFKALVHGPHSVVIHLDDVYDKELQASLKMLQDANTKEEAEEIMFSDKLITILDLAGTLRSITSTDDSRKIVASTAKWYVLGRATGAIESFENGLSVLGVLDAIKKNPKAFHTTFCYNPVKLTADILENLFRVDDSPTGSSKAVLESLVLSRWRDYLQDVEDGEEPIDLNDILFFATGCKDLPPRKIYPSIEFLHEDEACGKKSRFPKANTCSDVLRLPVVHSTYEEFKSDMNFGIQNGRGLHLP